MVKDNEIHEKSEKRLENENEKKKEVQTLKIYLGRAEVPCSKNKAV